MKSPHPLVPSLLLSRLGTAALLLATASGFAGVTVTGGTASAATSWSGTPLVASVSNPSGQTSVSEGFGGGATSYAQTFTVPVTSSYQLARICLYVGGGLGTSESAPLRVNLYDLGGQRAPNPSGYLPQSGLLGGGDGLAITYTAQSNGVLQLDFSASDRVLLVAGRMYAFELAGAAGTNPVGWLRGITDTYSGGAAYRNRSWINGSNARDFALAVYGTPTATPGTSSTINAAVTRQVIDGFGAGAAYLDNGIQRLTDAQMDALYGTGANQMGLTLIRVRISPTGAGDWGDPIANGQKAHQRGAKILASPWTPPVEMKDSGVIHTGSLLPSKYQDYVNYLNLFVDTMAASGAPVSVVSLQNEADYDPELEYDACLWTPEQFRVFCRDFAGGIHVPVMMPESFDFDPTLSDTALNDPAAAANIDVIGGHLYGATIRDYPLARALGKPIWMTEYLENDQTIESAIATAQQVQDCLTVGNMSGYIWWKTIGNANGLLNAAGVLQRRAYVMGQFSRFVRPGDIRIDVPANDSSLGISAFRNLRTGAFTIVAVNNTGAAIPHTFHLQGLTPAFVTPHVTSAAESLTAQTPITVGGGAFAYELPATSIVTFVGESTAPLVIVEAPLDRAVTAGQTLTLDATASGTPAPGYRWQANGVELAGTTGNLTITNFQPANSGLYSAIATNAQGSVMSEPVIVGVSSVEKVIGAGEQLLPVDIRHPNGNIFDQVLLTGGAETITADSGQITRTSFIDLDDDIVQVEFSGHGTLSVLLESPTGPAAPVNYNQPNVAYMKGRAGIVITGADETTHVSVFTVGRVTAFDPTGVYNLLAAVSATNDPAKNGSPLFVGHANTAYDGIADIAFIAIASTNGRFGSLRAANARCSADRGHTGIYAPDVRFGGSVFVGNIRAEASATPVFIIGSSPDTRITGGDLAQGNGVSVQVRGVTQLKFTAGSTSHGAGDLPAQVNRAVLMRNGVDVTTALVLNPVP